MASLRRKRRRAKRAFHVLCEHVDGLEARIEELEKAEGVDALERRLQELEKAA